MSDAIRFPFAERFAAPQGEGLYTGVQMSFARLVGCSVGQKVCTACDTNFLVMDPKLGGGMATAAEVASWAASASGVLCLTGGEPLDRDIRPLIDAGLASGIRVHVESSATVRPPWLTDYIGRIWLTVCPKPGWRQDMVSLADEVKVILGGLGDGPGWPTLEDALAWQEMGKLVYLQPRNSIMTVDREALHQVLETVARHPQLRVSVQLHKLVGTR